MNYKHTLLALWAGKRISKITWPKGRFLYWDDVRGKIFDNDGGEHFIGGYDIDFDIWQPPTHKCVVGDYTCELLNGRLLLWAKRSVNNYNPFMNVNPWSNPDEVVVQVPPVSVTRCPFCEKT